MPCGRTAYKIKLRAVPEGERTQTPTENAMPARAMHHGFSERFLHVSRSAKLARLYRVSDVTHIS